MLEEALKLYEELEDQFYELNGLEGQERPENEANETSDRVVGEPESTPRTSTNVFVCFCLF